MRIPKALMGIVLLYIAMGVLYSVTLPIFEAPDEMNHFRYVNWLADGNGLPHMITDLHHVGHEVGQPPLYYALLTPLVAWIDRHDLHQVAPVNAYWRQGAGINVHYHTAAESFPYRDTTLAVRLARWASILMGVVTVVTTFGIARHVLPPQAVWAAALVAFNPQFVFISAAVNNDVLVAALSALTLLMVIRQIADNGRPWWEYALLGLFWGLGILTKLSAAALGAVIIGGLAVAVYRHRSWRPLRTGLPVVVIIVAATTGWWFWRNWSLYADPVAWQPFLNANRPLLRPEMLSWGEALHAATFLPRSYWGVFAYGILAPVTYYRFVELLLLVGSVGLIIWFVRRGRHRLLHLQTLSVALLAGWSVIILVALIRWIRLVVDAEQGRLLFPAVSSAAVLLALGLTTLGPQRQWLLRSSVAILGVWTAVLPLITIQPAFARPKALPDLASLPNPQAVQFGDEIRLLAYHLHRPEARAGESVSVDLYWQAIKPISESYLIAVHVLDAQGQPVSKLDTVPYGGRYATPVWEPDRPFRDSYTLPPLPADATPGRATLLVTIYPFGRPDDALPATVHGVDVGTGVTLTNFKIAPVEPLQYQPSILTDAAFAAEARLIGFDAPKRVEAGESFSLTLYWEALKPTGRDYTVFVHLLDANGNFVAQADGPPQENRYPTSIWAPGEQIRDARILPVPADSPPGAYRLLIGLYEPQTGQRLPAIQLSGLRWQDDAVQLGLVEITPAH